MAAEMCDFYDLLNNFLGGIFWRLLCMYVHICAYKVREGMIKVGTGIYIDFYVHNLYSTKPLRNLN